MSNSKKMYNYHCEHLDKKSQDDFDVDYERNKLDNLSNDELFKIYQLGIKWQMCVLRNTYDIEPTDIITNFGEYVRNNFNK